jgi:hypothetical protein
MHAPGKGWRASPSGNRVAHAHKDAPIHGRKGEEPTIVRETTRAEHGASMHSDARFVAGIGRAAQQREAVCAADGERAAPAAERGNVKAKWTAVVQRQLAAKVRAQRCGCGCWRGGNSVPVIANDDKVAQRRAARNGEERAISRASDDLCSRSTRILGRTHTLERLWRRGRRRSKDDD